MINNNKIVGLMICIVAGSANAGTEAGNGDYCEQKGAVCKRTNFNISASHPQHKKLLDLIEAKELPRNLKHEMLRDLQETQIVYSEEQLRYKDLLARYEMQLNEVSRKNIYDRNGKLIRREEYEKWERVARLPNLGIYLNHEQVGYQAGQEDKLWVRAITQLTPKKVIYFTHFVNKMSESEQIKLVLHEQGHRLNFLAAFNDDERVVEGWANEMLSYLNGKISKEQFYKTMEAYKLNINGRFNFGNRKRAGATILYSDISVPLKKDFIVSSESTTSFNYIVGFAKNAFDGYPGLNTKDQIIYVKGDSIQGLQHVDSFFEPFINGQAEGALDLRVYFKSEATERDGVRSSSDQVVTIEPSTAHVENMYLQTQTVLNRFFSQIPADDIAYQYMDFGSYEKFVRPHSNIYARPELLFMSNFKAYSDNAVRVAEVIVAELQAMEASGDPFAALLRSKLNHVIISDKTYYANGYKFYTYNMINEQLMEPNVQTYESHQRRIQILLSDIHSVVVGFTNAPKVIFNQKIKTEFHYGTENYSWSQIEIYVSAQMTQEQILSVVRSGIEMARKTYILPVATK